MSSLGLLEVFLVEPVCVKTSRNAYYNWEREAETVGSNLIVEKARTKYSVFSHWPNHNFRDIHIFRLVKEKKNCIRYLFWMNFNHRKGLHKLQYFLILNRGS